MKSFILEQKRAIAKGFLVVLVMTVLMLALGRWVGAAPVGEFMESLGVWGPAFYVLLKALTVIVAPLSGTAIYVAGGALFGTGRALLYGTIGNFIGITICFFIGRTRGKKGIMRLLGTDFGNNVIAIVDKLSSSKNLFLTRIFLFPLEDLINYAAGISRISYVPFIIISMIVTVVASVFLILIGDLAI